MLCNKAQWIRPKVGVDYRVRWWVIATRLLSPTWSRMAARLRPAQYRLRSFGVGKKINSVRRSSVARRHFVYALIVTPHTSARHVARPPTNCSLSVTLPQPRRTYNLQFANTLNKHNLLMLGGWLDTLRRFWRKEISLFYFQSHVPHTKIPL